MNKARKVLQEAQQLAAAAPTWADFSNALYAPGTGLLTKAFPLGPARENFAKTPEYQAIGNLLEKVIERTGVVEGATPRKSGKFVVRLPSSLHAALELEAAEEGVSLNQLVLAKIALRLKQSPPAPSRRKSA